MSSDARVTTCAGRLRAAWARVRAKGGSAGADGVTLEDFEDSLERNLRVLAREYESREYLPFALLQIPVPKRSGGERLLAFPTVRDRVLQTTVMTRLEPVFEREYQEASFAYRRGRSVNAALRRVRDLRDDGFRWVLDADIDEFFDRISHERLLRRMAAVVPDEWDRLLLGLWVTAPRWDGVGLIVPMMGIPQGAVVSPSLANLFLDVLDERLEASPYRLVRYADDFLVLCRSREGATAALDLTDDLLERMGLDLDDEKTAITDFDRGFKFLGAVFVRSLIARPFENPPAKRQRAGVARPRVLAAGTWRMWLTSHGDDWRRYAGGAWAVRE